MKLAYLICLIAAFTVGREMDCSTMETYLGQDKSLLANNLINIGYKKLPDHQYLSQELANTLTGLSGRKLYGITLTKGVSRMVYIIYNVNGQCAAYTFIIAKGEYKTDTIEKEIEALGYENDNNPYAMNIVRGYSKGKKHFVVKDTDINGEPGIFISVHNVNPK